jgi:hypothetical protein
MEKPGGLLCRQMPAPTLLGRPPQRQNYYSDTNTRTGHWRTSTKSIKTESLLHLNLGNFIIFYFYFIKKILLLLLLLLFILSLSSYCLFSSLLISTLSLPVYFFGCFLFCFFPFFFIFFAFPLLSPFHSRYHHYYYKLDNTELYTVQGQ